MFDAMPRCEHDGIVVGNVDMLLAKFFGKNRLDLDKRSKINLYIVFSCDVKIRRFLTLVLWLRNQDFFFF